MKIEMDKNSIKLDINNEIKQLDRADKDSGKIALSHSAKIASDVRDYMYDNYLKTKYSASNPSTLDLSKNVDKKDKLGRRLVGFGLKSVTRSWKRATLASYPLNLYENDTKVYTKSNPWIKATHHTPITYKRKGTHIISRVSTQLSNIAKMSEEDFINEITDALSRVE